MSHILGLDFGTSFSTISFLNPDTGKPEVIEVYGWKQTPTIVFYGKEGILVGMAAANKLEEAEEGNVEIFQATFKSIKRQLDGKVAHPLPYGDGRVVYAVDVVADFIKTMKKYAEEHCFHSPVTKLRLTYPIAFKESQKKILKNAAIQAGFQEGNITMLYEPVAAALGYASTGFNLGRNILVYDLGGGTFDLALVHRHEDGTIEPRLEPVGIVGCAGDDFDLAIYKHWEERLHAGRGIRFHDQPGRVNLQVLLECRKSKEKLSDLEEAKFSKYFEREGVNFKTKLSRAEYEHQISSLIAKQIELTRKMLDDAASQKIEIDTFLLIGSATHTPLVRRELEKLFEERNLPLTLTKTKDAATAVALGAVVENTLRQPSPPPTPKPAPASAVQAKSVPSKKQQSRCPKCGFEFGWNGRSCRHCHYGETQQAPNQTQGTSAKRADGTKAGERMVLTIKGVEYPFRWCLPGTFWMGSSIYEKERCDGETLHQVTLTQGFWMLETQVTQEMWMDVIRNNPSYFKGKNLPVERVSWEDCQKYIFTLNEMRFAPSGYKFSLPNEAQWEYACRAGTTTRYNFGNEFDRNKANCGHGAMVFFANTTVVGSYPANAWGLFDMHGNVLEWCLDWYGDYPKNNVADPTGPTTGFLRVLRGGGYGYFARACRSARRTRAEPKNVKDLDCVYGFRLCLICDQQQQ